MVREWHHLEMIKRAKGGHDSTGTAATNGGEVGFLCTACPEPGMNLRKGWQGIPPDIMSVVFLILASQTNWFLEYRWSSLRHAVPSTTTSKTCAGTW
jgi:hypothetical protein